VLCLFTLIFSVFFCTALIGIIMSLFYFIYHCDSVLLSTAITISESFWKGHSISSMYPPCPF
jgi:hypothetical protein